MTKKEYYNFFFKKEKKGWKFIIKRILYEKWQMKKKIRLMAEHDSDLGWCSN